MMARLWLLQVCYSSVRVSQVYNLDDGLDSMHQLDDEDEL
jgi:hypothetical protein